MARWRASFLTGLAIVLPGVITLAVVKWLFGTVSSFTDTLLFFLPYCLSPRAIYQDGISGPMFWYWSLLALLLAVAIVSVVGVLARYYFGKRMIAWADSMMLRVPVLNKIYGTIKQVDEAFTSGKKSSFKTVVLVEYPARGNLFSRLHHERTGGRSGKKNRQEMRVRLHPDDADSDRRFFNRGAGGKSHQTRHVRGRRVQIHHQPRRAGE